MKVLRVSQEFAPITTGPIKQALNIMAGLSKRGHQNIVLASTQGLENNAPQVEAFPHDTEVHRYPILFKIMRYFFVRGVEKDLRKFDVDLVHVHSWRSHLADATIQIAKKRGIPSVLHAHASAYAEYLVTNPLLRFPYKVYDVLFKRRVVQAADAVVVSTEQEKLECIRYGISESCIHVIPSGVNTSDFEGVTRTRPPLPEVPEVLLVGRLARDRNVELLLRALAPLKQQGIPFHARIVGPEEKRTKMSRDGYLSELRALTRQLGLEGDVTFVGPLRGEALLQAYVDADIFVYPSLYENFGNTVLEAAAAGLPILATPTGVATDLIRDGETGYLVDMVDPTELSRHLSRLLRNPEERQQLGREVRRVALSEYNWDTIVERYVDLYGRLLERTPLAKAA